MRLFAFGDSQTYGVGLIDCWHDNDAAPYPSMHAWPAVMSKALGIPAQNLASPGCSNQWIMHTLRTCDISSDDIAIFVWTFADRFWIPHAANGEKPLRGHKIGPWLEDEFPWFYRIYDDHALVYESLICIEHARLWCESRGIRYFMYSNIAYGDPKIDHMIVGNFGNFTIGYAKDGKHACARSHKFFAGHLCRLLHSHHNIAIRDPLALLYGDESEDVVT